MGRVAVSTAGLTSLHADGNQIAQLPAASALAGIRREAGPGWLAAVEAVHASAPTIAVLGLDAALVSTAVAVTGGAPHPHLAPAAIFALAGRVGTVYRRRSTLEAQGIQWY